MFNYFTKLLLYKCRFGDLPWVQPCLVNTTSKYTVFYNQFTQGRQNLKQSTALCTDCKQGLNGTLCIFIGFRHKL